MKKIFAKDYSACISELRSFLKCTNATINTFIENYIVELKCILCLYHDKVTFLNSFSLEIINI